MLPIVVVTCFHNAIYFYPIHSKMKCFLFPRLWGGERLKLKFIYDYYTCNPVFFFKTVYWWSTSPAGQSQKVLVVGSKALNLT